MAVKHFSVMAGTSQNSEVNLFLAQNFLSVTALALSARGLDYNRMTIQNNQYSLSFVLHNNDPINAIIECSPPQKPHTNKLHIPSLMFIFFCVNDEFAECFSHFCTILFHHVLPLLGFRATIPEILKVFEIFLKILKFFEKFPPIRFPSNNSRNYENF